MAGLDQPLSITQDPSQPNVQIVVEKAGRLRVLLSGVLLNEPFLDLSGQISTDGEKGLLGLTFAPGYAQNGRFFVNYIDLNGNTVVSRFSRSAGDPLRADPASEFPLVWSDGQPFIFQPGPLHKGGHLAFGPDGMLYIGLGDGSTHNDPEHNAQNPTLLLGKILRININVLDSDAQGFDVPADNPFVNQEGVRPEIWSLGHRNPWRWTFDDPAHGGTGALIMADVGQDGWEEINYEPAGQGGRNYGWRNREGSHDYIAELPAFSEPLVDPVLEYRTTSTRPTSAPRSPAASSIEAARSARSTSAAIFSRTSCSHASGRCALASTSAAWRTPTIFRSTRTSWVMPRRKS